MFRPSTTIHVSPQGEAKTLVASIDAQPCLEAYRSCDKPGEVFYIRKGSLDKSKKIKAAAPAKKKTTGGKGSSK